MDYIELTVADMRFPLSGERVSAYLLAGPALGLRSSCRTAMSAQQSTFARRDWRLAPRSLDPPHLDMVQVEAVLADRHQMIGAECGGGALLARG